MTKQIRKSRARPVLRFKHHGQKTIRHIDQASGVTGATLARDGLPAGMQGAGIERALKAGDHLFHLGDRAAGIYQVLRGEVRLTRIGTNGQQVTLYAASAGDILAEAALFSPAYHCAAVAAGDAVVRFYPKAALLAALRSNPDAAQAFMAMLARQVMRLRTRLEQRNIRSARDRIRHYLACNVGADGRTIALAGTLKDLAAELGLTHEALYRKLSEMAADGEIERRKNLIRIKPARSV